MAADAAAARSALFTQMTLLPKICWKPLAPRATRNVTPCSAVKPRGPRAATTAAAASLPPMVPASSPRTPSAAAFMALRLLTSPPGTKAIAVSMTTALAPDRPPSDIPTLIAVTACCAVIMLPEIMNVGVVVSTRVAKRRAAAGRASGSATATATRKRAASEVPRRCPARPLAR